MPDVNYFVLGELFSLLERIEIMDEVNFSDFEPDDENDVRLIAEKYIKPSIDEAVARNRETIGYSIAYYSRSDSAPFQLMKDRCQELRLPDSESWPRFFDWIGQSVFGNDYLKQFCIDNANECIDEQASETILARE